MDNNGFIVFDIAGTQLTAEDRELLQHPLVAGLVLFTRNFADLSQLKNLIQEARAVRSAPLLVMVDHEGGDVQRFHAGLSELPPMENYGDIYEKQGLAQAQAAILKDHTKAASMLLSLGININLAPVLDVDSQVKMAHKTRCLHHDAAVVTDLSAAIIEAWQSQHMLVTAKHFPGHGGVLEDSHEVLPVDQRDKTQLTQEALLPFEKLAKTYDILMPAHIVYPQWDDQPATFSKFWLQKYLREHMGYAGVVLSDDLSMAACRAHGSASSCAPQALEAGCDFVLICNQRQAVIDSLDTLSKELLPEASEYRRNFYKRLEQQFHYMQ